MQIFAEIVFFRFQYRTTHFYYWYYWENSLKTRGSCGCEKGVLSDSLSGGRQLSSWVMIETQGDLESRSGLPLRSQFIGDLHFTTHEQPVFIVGHHILWGKVTDLTRPLLVFHKQSDQVHQSNSGEDIENQNECGNQFQILAVIRKKILFKSRPKPIIAHVPKKL